MPNGLEKALGLPSLKDAAGLLRNLPDEKKLHLVKQILDSAAKVKGGEEELQMALELIRVIASADMEHLAAIKDITSNLVKLVKLLPKDFSLDKLPLREIVDEIKR